MSQHTEQAHSIMEDEVKDDGRTNGENEYLVRIPGKCFKQLVFRTLRIQRPIRHRLWYVVFLEEVTDAESAH